MQPIIVTPSGEAYQTPCMSARSAREIVSPLNVTLMAPPWGDDLDTPPAHVIAAQEGRG